MLEEFEEGLNQIYGNFEKKMYDFTECLNYLKIFEHVSGFYRVDLKNAGSSKNTIEFIEKSDNLNISYPGWFKNDKGQGCIIQTNSKKIDLKFKNIHDGNLKVFLRGMDFRIKNNIKIRVFVNFTKLTINKNVIFDDNKLVWHDEPFEYSGIFKNNDVITLNVEYKNIFDYYPLLKLYLNEINDERDLNNNISKIINYITYEKILIQLNDMEKSVFHALNNL